MRHFCGTSETSDTSNNSSDASRLAYLWPDFRVIFISPQSERTIWEVYLSTEVFATCLAIQRPWMPAMKRFLLKAMIYSLTIFWQTLKELTKEKEILRSSENQVMELIIKPCSTGQEEWQYPQVVNWPFSSTGGFPFSSVCVTHQGWGSPSAVVQPVQEVPAKLNGKLHSGSGPDIVGQDAGWIGRPNGTQQWGSLYI